MGFPRVTRQHESEQRRRAMKGLVLIPNVVKRRWHQHILHVHYARRLRLQLLDVLAPGIGEIIGDSQREERLDVLDARMTALDIDKEHYSWYHDLRRYGTVPHAGFERTLAYVTGLANVRDAIPFPRTPGNARY